MSLCIRTIPTKLTPFVSSRNRVRKIDCRLPKDVTSSAFLEEFLGARAAWSCTSRTTRSRAASPYQTISRVTFNNRYKSGTKALSIRKILDEGNETYTHSWQRDLAGSYRPNVAEIKAIESLAIPENSAANASYGESNLGFSNCVGTFANESRKNDNNVAVESVHSWNAELQSDFKEQSILLSNKSPKDLSTTDQVQDVTSDDKKPTSEQLDRVFDTLQNDLPKFFRTPMDYTIYDFNIVFVNNIKEVQTVGLFPYMKQLALVKILAHLRYVQVRMEILKMTKHPEEGVIKVRWRVRCMKHFKSIMKFLKNKEYQKDKNQQEQPDHEVWYDGFSTYYVSEKGVIHKHVVDKVIPDDTYEVTKKAPLASKLALLMGIISIDNFSQQYPFK